jgi:hypothetical protein
MRRMAATPVLEDREITQQRYDADDDYDDAHDLFGAAVNRQHVDEIEDKNDDQKGDQNTDEDGHENPRVEMSELTLWHAIVPIFLWDAQSLSATIPSAAANNEVRDF